MKENKVKDFYKKLSAIREMAEYFGWQFIDGNASNGQIHFIYPAKHFSKVVHLNIWTTKMTVVVSKNKRVETLKAQSIQNIENILEIGLPNKISLPRDYENDIKYPLTQKTFK